MLTGETVAVKVLATDSKQGEKEFQTEVVMDNAQSFTVLGNLLQQLEHNVNILDVWKKKSGSLVKLKKSVHIQLLDNTLRLH